MSLRSKEFAHSFCLRYVNDIVGRMANVDLLLISMNLSQKKGKSCIFRKRNYRVLVRVSVCVSVCVRVCVFLHDNSKRNQSRNMKFEYIVVYEISSDEFHIEHYRIKVKVTVEIQRFSPFTTIHTVRSYTSTLEQARKLLLSRYVHLIVLCKSLEC